MECIGGLDTQHWHKFRLVAISNAAAVHATMRRNTKIDGMMDFLSKCLSPYGVVPY